MIIISSQSYTWEQHVVLSNHISVTIKSTSVYTTPVKSPVAVKMVFLSFTVVISCLEYYISPYCKTADTPQAVPAVQQYVLVRAFKYCNPSLPVKSNRACIIYCGIFTCSHIFKLSLCHRSAVLPSAPCDFFIWGVRTAWSF